MKTIMYIGSQLTKDFSVHGKVYHFVNKHPFELEDNVANLLLRDVKLFKEVIIEMPKFIPKQESGIVEQPPAKAEKYKRKRKE